MATGGGNLSTVINLAWSVIQHKNHKTQMSGYQDKGNPKLCDIVNSVSKATISGREDPILLIMNYVTFVEDGSETESLCQPFNLMFHGIKVYMVPEMFGGKQVLTIKYTFIPLNFDGEKLYLSISNPALDEIGSLHAFELTSPVPSSLNVTRRNKQTKKFYKIEMSEWGKRLAIAPMFYPQNFRLYNTILHEWCRSRKR